MHMSIGRDFALLACSALCFVGCGPSEPRRPNVVLIVVDTLRADTVLDPKGDYTTPHIDALAADGVLFPQAFAHAPMTLPAHASLFSSRPPFETGVVNNGQAVPKDLPLLAEWLGTHGYESRAVTSLATLSSGESQPGLARGFDAYDTDFSFIDPADRVFARMEASLKGWRGRRPLFFFGHFSDPHEPYTSHENTDRDIAVLLDDTFLGPMAADNLTIWDRTVELSAGAHKLDFGSIYRFIIKHCTLEIDGIPLEIDWDKDPHRPGRRRTASFAAPEPGGDYRLRLWLRDVISPEEMRRRYAVEVEYVDQYVGSLVELLKERGIYDDSLVIFTSDHGECLGERSYFGHVQFLTNELLGVPLIIKPPRGHPMALDPARLTRHMDLVPTILETIGVPALPGQQGQSLLQPSDVVPVHISETHKPEAKKDKLAVHDDRYKMIYTVDDGSIRMFDLHEDPGELVDIFAQHADLRADWPELLRKLAEAATHLKRKPGELAPELENELRALGYGG